MCDRPAFVQTRDRLYWLQGVTSHQRIIKHYGLSHLDNDPLVVGLVRIHAIPPKRDYRAPLDKWHIDVEQDEFPEWFDWDKMEDIVRAELPRWYEANVQTGLTKEVNEPLVCITGKVERLFAPCRIVMGHVENARFYGEIDVIAEGAQIDEITNVAILKNSGRIGLLGRTATLINNIGAIDRCSGLIMTNHQAGQIDHLYLSRVSYNAGRICRAAHSIIETNHGMIGEMTDCIIISDNPSPIRQN